MDTIVEAKNDQIYIDLMEIFGIDYKMSQLKDY
jgi:hypothetical protein